MAVATEIVLSADERRTPLWGCRAGKTERRVAERAQIILEAAAGKTNHAIAERLETRSARVSTWRTRFARARLEGLAGAPRSRTPAPHHHRAGGGGLTPPH